MLFLIVIFSIPNEVRSNQSASWDTPAPERFKQRLFWAFHNTDLGFLSCIKMHLGPLFHSAIHDGSHETLWIFAVLHSSFLKFQFIWEDFQHSFWSWGVDCSCHSFPHLEFMNCNSFFSNCFISVPLCICNAKDARFRRNENLGLDPIPQAPIPKLVLSTFQSVGLEEGLRTLKHWSISWVTHVREGEAGPELKPSLPLPHLVTTIVMHSEPPLECTEVTGSRWRQGAALSPCGLRPLGTCGGGSRQGRVWAWDQTHTHPSPAQPDGSFQAMAYMAQVLSRHGWRVDENHLGSPIHHSCPSLMKTMANTSTVVCCPHFRNKARNYGEFLLFHFLQFSSIDAQDCWSADQVD